MPFCTNCGHDNPEASNFCSNCGSALTGAAARPEPAPERIPTGDTTKTIPAIPEDQRDGESLSAEDEAAVSALPAGSALLIVQRGSNAGSRFLLNTDLVTAGRHQDSDIFLDDISGISAARHVHQNACGHTGEGHGQPERNIRQPRPR